jgi:hypothetical protein
MPVPITRTLASVQVAARAPELDALQPRDEPHASAMPEGMAASADAGVLPGAAKPVEIGGPAGPEPTRYGDWERRGRCIDF